MGPVNSVFKRWTHKVCTVSHRKRCQCRARNRKADGRDSFSNRKRQREEAEACLRSRDSSCGSARQKRYGETVMEVKLWHAVLLLKCPIGAASSTLARAIARAGRKRTVQCDNNDGDDSNEFEEIRNRLKRARSGF